jgi:hypothetical protein
MDNDLFWQASGAYDLDELFDDNGDIPYKNPYLFHGFREVANKSYI